MIEQWHLGALIGLLALHVLFSYGAFRRYRREARGGDEAATGSASAFVDPHDGVVECPECGSENELGYRYCRSCVGELPGSREFQRGGDRPLGRLT